MTLILILNMVQGSFTDTFALAGSFTFTFTVTGKLLRPQGAGGKFP